MSYFLQLKITKPLRLYPALGEVSKLTANFPCIILCRFLAYHKLILLILQIIILLYFYNPSLVTCLITNQRRYY